VQITSNPVRVGATNRTAAQALMMQETRPDRAFSTELGREEFVQANLRRIYLQVYRIVGNADDAQDLTQEVFIKALQRNEQIQDAQKAAHWLSRIATHTAIDFLRRRKRSPFSPSDDLTMQSTSDTGESPEQGALRGEQRSILDAGLKRLSERERTALVLRDVEGFSAEEVAEHLSCSKATVRSHIANARVKFKRFLDQRGAL
jgi:RNA polymerase sigma-70 factor, ECF subfamily